MAEPRYHLEDQMVAIAAYIEQQGGEVRTDPGHLLRHLTEQVCGVQLDIPLYGNPAYISCSRALLALEEQGFVEIERVGWHRAHKGNQLVAVRLL